MRERKSKDPDVFFVTGTDTGIGKTLTTTVLMKKEQQSHCRVIGMKPIASGCNVVQGELRNIDADVLRISGSVSLPYQQVNPIALEAPVSPHLLIQRNQILAALVSDPIKYTRQCMAELPRDLDVILIEGAGGWRAPLTGTLFFSDLAKCFTTKVVLVVGMKLGCLNHAQLSAEAILNDGCEVVGWVANCIDASMEALEENIEALESRLPYPRLFTIPTLSVHEPIQPLNESHSQMVNRELRKVVGAMEVIDFKSFQSLM